MKMRHAFLASVLMVTTIAFAMGQHDAHLPHPSESSDPEWKELSASMTNMHLVMATLRPSGNGDTDFVKLMLPHHQAAIDMARAQLTYGTDPQMRRLAQEIIADQQSEIELMQVWLKQHEAQQTPLLRPTK
jgi:uncharacterized protein (DUF305 family)